MTAAACHGEVETPRDRAKTLVLRTLGVSRVASWCGVTENAVYQWLSRGTDQEPIPPRAAGKIAASARAEGVTVDLSVLWPAIKGAA